MDQTTIKQFFVSRKSSSSDRPAKRQKLSVTSNVDSYKPLPRAIRKGARKPSLNGRKSKRSHEKKILQNDDNNLNFLSDLFNAKPIELKQGSTHDSPREGGIITPKKSGGINLVCDPDDDVFTDIKSYTPGSIASNDRNIPEIEDRFQEPDSTKNISHTPTKSRVDRGAIKVDDAINDQAKTILFSRGSSILKAGLQKDFLKSPSKASEVLDCLSPHKKEVKHLTVVDTKSQLGSHAKSPAKLSELLNTLSPPEKSVNVESVSGDILERRGRLRNKYAHLLKKEDDSKVVAPCTPVADEVAKKRLDFPVQENSSKGKAHERFKHLTQKAAPSGFALPQKFKSLFEMFRCADSVLYLLNQRKEACTFDRLKKSVQSMCGRDFTRDHLAAMKTVYPAGFLFRQEKGLPISNLSNGQSNSYQLTIEANFKESLISNSKLTPNVLITRKLKFENQLLSMVKEHHQKFLRKLNMKLSDSEIHRWHPHFKVDEVPDIELSCLPQPPIFKGFTSAADMILKNRGVLAAKVEKALIVTADKARENEANTSKTKSESDDSSNKSPAESKTTTTSSTLKGVSQSLLQRIRDKEQKRMQLAMTRDPKKEERLSNMARLPEICRILKSYFTTEKKVAITLEDCVQKLTESYGSSLHSAKLEEHVRLLGELVPEWLTIVMVRKYPYVKLVKGYDINTVLKSLDGLQVKESAT